MDNKTIGRRIRSFRNLRGLSQAEVAGKLKMDPGGYSRLESGESEVSVKRLSDLASVLELADMLTPVDNPADAAHPIT